MKKSRKRIEPEAKFLLDDPAAQIPALLQWLRKQGVQVGDSVTYTQLDRYFDTHHWHLYRVGWSYRFRDTCLQNRSIDLNPLWPRATVPGERPLRTGGMTVAVDALPETNELPQDEAPLNQELKEFLHDCTAPLQEIFRMRTEREVYRLSLNDAELLLCIDATTVELEQQIESQHPNEFVEVKLELKVGHERKLRQLVNGIRKKLQLPTSRMRKFERALQAGGRIPAISLPEDPGEETPPDLGIPVTAFARTYFLRQFRQLLQHDASICQGDVAKSIHQMRVASRRLRIGLELFRDYLPGDICKSLSRELKWLARALGPVCDFEVFWETATREAMEAKVEIRDFRVHLEAARTAAHNGLIKALTSGRWQRFRRDFAVFLESGFWAGNEEPDDPPLRELPETVLLPILKRFRREGDGIDDATAAEVLHRLRVDCEKLRYRLESFAPLFPGDDQWFVRSCKTLQDYLGAHQDACVALACIDAFRKSNQLKGRGKFGLKELRKIIKKRRRRLRKAYAKNWNNFSAGTRPRTLRKRLKAPTPLEDHAPSEPETVYHIT